ncbi:MAG: hypothetical protein ACLSB9_17910 [Hydrogeniiclostridium mannosilyticum]
MIGEPSTSGSWPQGETDFEELLSGAADRSRGQRYLSGDLMDFKLSAGGASTEKRNKAFMM